METDCLVEADVALSSARLALRNAKEAAKRAAIAAHRRGMPETEIANALHVNRMTVRRWLGKLT